MGSLDQYITLYNDNAPLIAQNAPEAMNALRGSALEALRMSAGLPTTKTPGYQKTSIDRMMEPDLGVNLSRLNFNADIAATFHCDIPNMSTLLGVVVNDIFHPTATLLHNLPEGVIVSSFSKLADNEIARQVISRHYGRIAPLSHPAVALNTLLAQDALLVYIPRDVRLAKPIQIVNIFASPSPLAAFRRVLVVAEAGAEASLLLCDHTQSHSTEFISQQVIEVSVGANARVDICDMEKSTPLTRRHAMMYVKQDEGSDFMSNITTLTCGTTRNELTVALAAPHCKCRATGMAIASGDMHIDNATFIDHLSDHCDSDQLYKYVLDNRAQGAFEGTIHVGADAPYTSAYQSNRNIVASTEAKMHTEPQLLIYNDEVRCSHGATTGTLDAEALFYMQTRGIPQEQARRMLMQAFMVDVIDSLRLDALRERLRMLVERRFASQSARCESCSLNSES